MCRGYRDQGYPQARTTMETGLPWSAVPRGGSGQCYSRPDSELGGREFGPARLVTMDHSVNVASITRRHCLLLWTDVGIECVFAVLVLESEPVDPGLPGLQPLRRDGEPCFFA